MDEPAVKTEKKLAPGELRFAARLFDAKQKLWGIYDKARGSWPHTSGELGDVRQGLKLELEAEEEAKRLNARHSAGAAAASTAKSTSSKKTRSSKTVQAADVEELAAPVPELPDYGVMTDEERKKYEEGLF